jgi:polysaccharide export outer membrane protein
MNNLTRTLGILTFSLIMLCAAQSVGGQSVSKTKADEVGQTAPMDKPPRATLDETGPAIHKRNWRYTIHPSDTLELTFMLTPEFNRTVTVQPDGYITLRDVGDILATGNTLSELTESIKKAYGKILLDPVISIELKDFEKPYFVVGGQVGRPGKFDWRGEVTLTQAIEIAGGFTDTAKHSQVLLFRRVSDQWAQAKLINVKHMLRARDLQEDRFLQPGDMLYVPKNTISKVRPFIPIPSIGAYARQF